MKRTFLFASAALALAAAAPAHAAIIAASFSGNVASQLNSGKAVGSAVGGSFIYNTVKNVYLSFTIAGQSYAPSTLGSVASASVTPDQLSAIYEAQNSQTQGAPSNSSFVLDLEGLAAFGSTDPVYVAGHLASLSLDSNPADAPFNSTFSYNTYDTRGTLTSSVIADLATVNAAIPEPASLGLLTTAVFGFGATRRRRRG